MQSAFALSISRHATLTLRAAAFMAHICLRGTLCTDIECISVSSERSAASFTRYLFDSTAFMSAQTQTTGKQRKRVNRQPSTRRVMLYNSDFPPPWINRYHVYLICVGIQSLLSCPTSSSRRHLVQNKQHQKIPPSNHTTEMHCRY